MRKGILYIATDEDYLEQAELSAKVLQQTMDIPIGVVSNQEVSSPYFDEVIIDEVSRENFDDKPRNIHQTPFDKTIYIDTDIYIISNIEEIFDMLDHVDIATTIDPNEFELRIEGTNPKNIPESYPIYQTGLIAFNSDEKVLDFFKKWEQIHTTSDIERDQTSFRVALYYHGHQIRHATISPNYNFLVGSPMRIIGEVKAIHDTKNDLNSYDRINEYNTRINSTRNQRLVYSYGDEIVSPLSKSKGIIFAIVSETIKFYDLIYFTIESLWKDGLSETINRIKRYMEK